MSSAVHKRSFWLVADTQDGFDQRPASPVSYCTAHPNWYLTSSSCQAQSKPDLRTTCIIFRTLHRECHVLGILSWAYFNDSSPGSRSVNLWYIISGPPPWNGECSPFPGMSPPPLSYISNPDVIPPPEGVPGPQTKQYHASYSGRWAEPVCQDTCPWRVSNQPYHRGLCCVNRCGRVHLNFTCADGVYIMVIYPWQSPS